MNTNDLGYTTEKEKKFLDKLGSYTPKEHRRPRDLLLRNYIMMIPSRKIWGDIDRVIVADYASQLLRIEIDKEVGL